MCGYTADCGSMTWPGAAGPWPHVGWSSAYGVHIVVGVHVAPSLSLKDMPWQRPSSPPEKTRPVTGSTLIIGSRFARFPTPLGARSFHVAQPAEPGVFVSSKTTLAALKPCSCMIVTFVRQSTPIVGSPELSKELIVFANETLLAAVALDSELSGPSPIAFTALTL